MSRMTLLLAAALSSPLVSAATDQERNAALVDGLVFFGGMFLLVIYAAIMRLRDASAGLSKEERQARMKRRLPWVMGAMMGLVLYTVLSL